MATKKYECGRCAELHDWEDDALECCQPEPKEVYICDECEEAHESVREAEHCCAETDDSYLHMATQRELEKAGQQRLPI